jgi:hypothetical protein
MINGQLAVVGTLGWVITDPGYSEWFDAEADDRELELARRFAAELEQTSPMSTGTIA